MAFIVVLDSICLLFNMLWIDKNSLVKKQKQNKDKWNFGHETSQ